MNETVTIKEGGLTRRLAPIDKLKVNTTDNKDSTWVSAGKANTGVLHASENGIYIASEDGYEAYSEVIVRVTKDSFEGDTSFDDWDYETPDMDLDNWDPGTIEDFELDPDGFDDVFNNEDEWKDIDKPIDIKMDNPKIQDMKISGIDPVTGNEMEVGLDADGYLTESTLPSSIKIEVLPSKLQYVEGQPIYLRGIVVKAYTEDGNLWTDSAHPDGIIPESELSLSPTTASIGTESEYGERDISGTELNEPVYLTPLSVGMKYANLKIIEVTGSPLAFVLGSQSHSSRVIVSYSPSSVTTAREDGTYPATYIAGNKIEYNNKIGYCSFISEGPDSISYPVSADQSIGIIEAATIALLGTKGKIKGSQEITVIWVRSDGEELTDTYTIEVLPDPDGSHQQVDPGTVVWNNTTYKANEDLGSVEVRHGSVYMEGGAIYDVGAAVRLGMLEPVDNEIVP